MHVHATFCLLVLTTTRDLGVLTSFSAALPCSLHSLAPFMGSLTSFANSLVGQLKFMDICVHAEKRVQREESRLLSLVETRPKNLDEDEVP